MLYLQLALFPLLAFAGIWLGHWCGKRRGWWILLAAALAVITLVILGQRIPSLHFVPPMSWAVDANVNPSLMTFAVGAVLTPLLMRLPRRQTRRLLAVAMGVLLFNFGILPATMPLAARASLLARATVINRDGICLQQHGYTCGPASAVTCLRKLGMSAEEGALAVDARSGPAVGTDGFLLAAAVEREFPVITCRYRYAATLEDVRLPAVADMMLPQVGGHYVAVLQVTAEEVVVGDPLSGVWRMGRAEFLAGWKHGVVEFERH